MSFYFRYYVGHRGKFGHEFLEFEIRDDGRLRYANSSHYKSDVTIRKEVFVSQIVVDELKRIIRDSNLVESVGQADSWPKPDKSGKQEMEICIDNHSVDMEVAKIGTLGEINSSSDPNGLRIFHYLVLDIKCMVFSLINLHFRLKPV
jgi:protein mago nashi